MSSKHTPGPWLIEDKGYPLRIVDSLEVGATEICVIGGSGFCPESEEENRANARLIALAPKLLAICRGLSGEIDFGGEGEPFHDRVLELRQLIAEVEG